MFDEYERKAKIYPAILILFPFFVLQVFYLNKEVTGWLDFVGSVRAITLISLPLVFMYFVVSVARLIAKAMFENLYFKDSLHMPTTNFLLYSTRNFSSKYKAAIRSKLKKEFSVVLSSENEEQLDEIEARRRIIEAVSYIRNKVKHGYLLLKHNIQYGFWRNLVGGSVIGLILSLINLFVFYYIEPNNLPWILSIIMCAIYSLILLSSKWVISYLGKLYAYRLYEEYMSQ
ncbi:hypothetical protein AHMF7605_28635 [Adhaeribacter arboris]|uniref:Uncharacterized protein n=1 Tax=Adhaeribacter arboris TaxID=2072846 RepID=A0A2T2Y8M5_9BACT|nr:hypothetical protein [Adhaeribacter arboris]PSR51881.1 hypothetical protein AHMF7605_28635 [Adhaeribacter arboris]